MMVLRPISRFQGIAQSLADSHDQVAQGEWTQLQSIETYSE